MQEPTIRAHPGTEWALSWAVQEIDDVRLVYHFGDMIGHHAILYMAPARRFAISVLSNTDWSMLKQEVVREALKRYLAIEEPEPQEIELSEADLSGILGQYDGQLATIELLDDGVNLLLSWTPKESSAEAFAGKWPIKPYNRDRFFLQIEKSARGEFLRDTGDRVIWLRWWGSLYRRVTV
jgi:hypothetical protein